MGTASCSLREMRKEKPEVAAMGHEEVIGHLTVEGWERAEARTQKAGSEKGRHRATVADFSFEKFV